MKKCRLSGSLILLAIMCLSLGSADAQVPHQVVVEPESRFEPVRQTILKAIQAGDVPSVAVAVAHKGTIIWEEAFGWANREHLIPATPHTMYSLASISKPLIATGMMLLKERGLVDLETPVNVYISPAKLTAHEGDANGALLRHILNHTSGLPVHYSVFYLDEPNRQPPPFVESIHRYGILVHPPGMVYQYANFGYGLAGHIIERVSGMSLADFMRKQVFLPLGMNRSALNVPLELEKFAAVRYDTRGNPVPFYISDHPGASQFYSSAHDLIRFALFQLGCPLPEQTPILTQKSLHLMQTDSDPNPDNDRYGLGWFLRDDEFGYRVVWHTGSMRGVNNMLKMVPEEKLAVVILINTASPLRVQLANDIIGILLPDYGEKWRQEKEKEPEPREPYKPNRLLIGEWEGEIRTYEEIVPVSFLFQNDGDVHVRVKGHLETLLNRVRFDGRYLTGVCSGEIPSGDARAFPHRMSFKLLLQENRLSGYVTTVFTTERSYGNFSSYVILEKVK